LKGLRAVPQIDLDTPIQFVRGVGPMRSRYFEALGVRSAGDLLAHFPFRYETIPASIPIGELLADVTATVIGGVEAVRSAGGRGHPSVVVKLVDGTGRCRVRWFNAPYMADRIHRGDTLRLSGRVGQYRDQAEFVNPQCEVIENDCDPFDNDRERVEAVYPGSAQLKSSAISGIVAGVLDIAAGNLVEFLPEPLLSKRNLPPRRQAVVAMHRPTTMDDVRAARRRVAYDELFLLLLAVLSARQHRVSDQSGRPIFVSEYVDARIRRRFPFSFTPSQNAAVTEITADMQTRRPMNRLLQGDVGSGKTAVAIYAALATIANGKQVAMLAPTEVLAEQHYRKAEQYLNGSRVAVDLLVGRMRKVERQNVLANVESGALNLLVGTHALLEKDVRFNDLGLIVIDEQHRFGVSQRATARAKGHTPHCLVMTATPIPRTLAMTYFGDLDFTTIAKLPAGRQTVSTRRVAPDDLTSAWKFVCDRLTAGEQAYIVYPIVEESDTLDLKAATVEFEHLRSGPFSGFQIGLLHGRMSSRDKSAVLDAFRQGQLHVLVATTVIEVGVDVPNATVMVIEHAERFGLSQLHQLRGRVGRGKRKSYCLLVSGDCGVNAYARLDALCRTHDGFEIAEEDLRLRGPGEFLGRRQHGDLGLKAADLSVDLKLLEQAREDAMEMLDLDADLKLPEHFKLRDELRRRFGRIFPLVRLAQA